MKEDKTIVAIGFDNGLIEIPLNLRYVPQLKAYVIKEEDVDQYEFASPNPFL